MILSAFAFAAALGHYACALYLCSFILRLSSCRNFRRIKEGEDALEARLPAQMTISATAEYEKWVRFDPRLIFTNCGALTWYLRKAWLLDNAPELMPPSDLAEAFEIRRSVRSRLAKADYFSHVRIRTRLAFAERLLYERNMVYQSHSLADGCWREDDRCESRTAAPNEPAPEQAFGVPGKPRALRVADVGHQWIYLKWKWPRSKVTRLGYRIERSARKSSNYEVIAVTHACDLLLLPVGSGKPYFYRVRAFNPAGDGPPSEPLAGAAF